MSQILIVTSFLRNALIFSSKAFLYLYYRYYIRFKSSFLYTMLRATGQIKNK